VLLCDLGRYGLRRGSIQIDDADVPTQLSQVVRMLARSRAATRPR
jgi:hypothetical protein